MQEQLEITAISNRPKPTIYRDFEDPMKNKVNQAQSASRVDAFKRGLSMT